MKYSIGLDCGITSVGYAVMALDSNDEPYRIIRLGSRIFEGAENPKNGSSLALPRREARGSRRRVRRHKHRIERIKQLIVSGGLLEKEQLDSLFDGKLSDVYQLRADALDRKLSNDELARVLIHLAQRRGFKSNRKSEGRQDKEMGRLLNQIDENSKIMQENEYRTVGEMLYKHKEKFGCSKRNKGESYANTVTRAMIEDEAKQIFSKQRALGNAFAGENNEEKYLSILLSQRPFDVGPGKGPENSPSPYYGDQIFQMIGNCRLLPEEKRAAKATYSFQMFNLWQNINNIKLVSESGAKRSLDAGERGKVFELCKNTENVNYKRIRKKIEISKDYTFVSLSYGDKDIDEVEEKAKFNYLKAYHDIRKALDQYEKGYIEKLTGDEIDAIGTAFTLYKNDEKIKEYLSENGIDEKLHDCLLELKGFSKFGHISIKACKEITPYLKEGYTYDKACEAAGIDFKGHGIKEKGKYLPAKDDALDDIVNPVVRRSVSQTIKVINAIIREMKESPVYINIELARDLSKSKKERDEIDKNNKENRAINEKIKERLQEDFKIRYPSGQDIVKLKLWDEQNGICPYTQEYIDPKQLFGEAGYAEVDHIIPYSRSFDDSYNNKVLTFEEENREKGNKTPLEYLGGKRAEDFRVYVENHVKNLAKKRNLLKEKVSEDDSKELKSRNLNDTRYLSRFLLNYINDNLAFKPFSNENESDKSKRIHTRSVNGAATAYMRKRWGIQKLRENGDLHHAVDAAVIACVTQSNIQNISKYSKQREIGYSGLFAVDQSTGEVIDKFPLPYPEFRKELEYRISNDPKRCFRSKPLANYTAEEIETVKPVFVSRMANHKVTGAAHEATIRSGREKGYKISKTALSDLKLDKNGEIKNYYNRESDRLLYEALKARLKEYGGDGKKAFPADEPFHKPKADGCEGPVVKKVKIREKISSWVCARGEKGIAENGSMIRIDIYYVENDGYYLVPVYVADTVKEKLPDLACVANGKPWKKMDEKDFCFSLYANDLIKVTAKKDFKMTVVHKDSTLPKEKYGNEMILYYKGADISTASITVESHDGSYKIRGLGIKSLVKIEKYAVDPLGNLFRVNGEKRMGFKSK